MALPKLKLSIVGAASPNSFILAGATKTSPILQRYSKDNVFISVSFQWAHQGCVCPRRDACVQVVMSPPLIPASMETRHQPLLSTAEPVETSDCTDDGRLALFLLVAPTALNLHIYKYIKSTRTDKYTYGVKIQKSRSAPLLGSKASCK